jgi:hypothetical protein
MRNETSFSELTAGSFLGIPGQSAGDLYIALQALTAWIENRPRRTTLYFRRSGDPEHPPEPEAQFCRCCKVRQFAEGRSVHLDSCLVGNALRVMHWARAGVPCSMSEPQDYEFHEAVRECSIYSLISSSLSAFPKGAQMRFHDQWWRIFSLTAEGV